MKRVTLISLILLLGGFISTSFAVEVTLFGPQTYERGKGKHDKYTDSFEISGLTGTGKLIVYNGDGGKKTRVKSAEIKFNKKKVLKGKDFKKKHHKKHHYLEVPVTLEEQNTISIKLKGKRGSYVTVEVIKEVEAEAAAVCGPGGCEVEGAGAKIEVSAGILDDNIIITVSDVEDPPPLSNPEEIIESSRTIDIQSSTELSGHVVVTIPSPVRTDIRQNLKVLFFNEDTATWEEVPILVSNPISETVSFLTDHFSWYRAVIETAQVFPQFDMNRTLPGFKFGLDTTSFDNNDAVYSGCRTTQQYGVCHGASSLVKYWYEQKDSHLRCSYSLAAGAPLVCDLQDIQDSIWLLILRVFIEWPENIFDATDIWQDSILALESGKMPLISMLDPEDDRKHSLAAYKWEFNQTGDILGYLYVYDSNYPSDSENRIVFSASTWLGVPIVTMSYERDTGYKFFTNSIIYRANFVIEGRINDYPPDNWCEPETVNFDDWPDIPYNEPSQKSPDKLFSHYQNLAWGGIGYLDPTENLAWNQDRGRNYSTTGYLNCITSQPHVAFNWGGEPAGIWGGPFDFIGANFGAAWRNDLNVKVEGYLENTLKYSKSVIVQPEESEWVDFNFRNVDLLVFKSSGGTRATQFGVNFDGYQFIMDDLVVMNIAPPSRGLKVYYSFDNYNFGDSTIFVSLLIFIS